MSVYLDLCNRMREGEFNYAFSISLKNKYVYVENAKSACTTLKSILGEWEFSGCKLGADIPNTFFSNVHVNVIGTPFVKPFQLGERLFNEIIASDEYFRFAFVRNPFTRVLSAYLDKVLGGKPEAEQIMLEAQRLGFSADHADLSFVSFLKCVESIQSRKGYLDKHWRPQSLQLSGDKINYDKICKVENLEADLQSVADALNMKFCQTRRTFGHETRASEQVLQHYDDEARSILIKTFESDFKVFGYETDLT